jgi:hypothetical protein
MYAFVSVSVVVVVIVVVVTMPTVNESIDARAIITKGDECTYQSARRRHRCCR